MPLWMSAGEARGKKAESGIVLCEDLCNSKHRKGVELPDQPKRGGGKSFKNGPSIRKKKFGWKARERELFERARRHGGFRHA